MSITIAIPSKGRLKDDCFTAFSKVGLEIVPLTSSRSYSTHIRGREDIKIKLLSATEIAKELVSGSIDLGVTGKDLLYEAGDKDKYHDALPLGTEPIAPNYGLPDLVPLGFGKADVVVAVPNHWWDVQTMADLSDIAADFHNHHNRRLRVASKYFRLTQDFFESHHGLNSYEIIDSKGATEAAPSTGLADLIVDITSTGETLEANHLKILKDGVILKSQACLVRSIRYTHHALANEVVKIFST
jgi:ATP phosphoribosyltransferase